MKSLRFLLDNKNPLLFIGARGVGKKTAFLSAIKFLNCKSLPFENPYSCTCEKCASLAGGPDILILEGSESFSFVKDTRNAFFQSGPMCLESKYIFLNNLEFWGKKSQDLFLSLTETPPPDFFFFASAQDLRLVPESLQSRFMHVFFPPIENDRILENFKNTPSYLKLSELFEQGFMGQSYTFASNFINYKYSQVFSNIFQSGDIKSTCVQINAFLDSLENLSVFIKNSIIFDFLNYAVFMLHKDTSIGKLTAFTTIISRYSESLFKYLNYPNSAYYVSIDKQFTSFCYSFFSLRKLFNG